MAAPTTPAFIPVDTLVGVPPINQSIAVNASLTQPLSASGTPAVPSGYQAVNQLGMILKAWDPNYGVGEFIYLVGVAATKAQDLVIYDTKANTTTRTVAASRGPVAVSMSANVANQAGWYQISGAAVINDNGTAALGRPYLTATAGAISSTQVNGQGIDGAIITVAENGGNQCVVELDRPTANGLN